MQGKAHSSTRWPGQSVPRVGREDGTGGRALLPAAWGHVTCHLACHALQVDTEQSGMPGADEGRVPGPAGCWDEQWSQE